MYVGEHVGFWSYEHRDNDLDRGRVARLAEDIADEFELQTGDILKMFIDRNSIKWGDEWRRRLGQALDGSVFFIAIITPLYLRSVECRREFSDFVAQLHADKRERILLPILYSHVPAAEAAASEDQIMQMVLRTQYEDWRRLRLSENSSSEYRRKIHDMVIRIIEIMQTQESNLRILFNSNDSACIRACSMPPLRALGLLTNGWAGYSSTGETRVTR